MRPRTSRLIAMLTKSVLGDKLNLSQIDGPKEGSSFRGTIAESKENVD